MSTTTFQPNGTPSPYPSNSKPTYRILVLIFSGADILDFTGPIEILSHALHNRNPEAPEPIFSLDTAARNGLNGPGGVVTGKGMLTIQPTKTISQVLDTEGGEGLEGYDGLIVPGGPPNVMMSLLQEQELVLVRRFAEIAATKGATELTRANGKTERVLMSVCTGAFLLAAAGLLDGVECTTHHMALGKLEEMTGKRAKVLGGRSFVDAGKVKEGGLRIITSGGISSGLDAALHFVEVFADEEIAAFIGRVMEYERKDNMGSGRD